MITVDDLKEYLYIPNEITNDDRTIGFMIDASYSYLRGAVDDFDALYKQNLDFKKQADLYALFYTAELYQNRNQFNSDRGNSYMTRSLITQLQTYKLEDKKNG